MIELTKQQFNEFLGYLIANDTIGTFNGLTDDEIMSGLFIAKYHLEVGVSNVIAYNYNANNPVFLYKPSTFTFNDNPSYVDYYNAESPQHSPSGFNLNNVNHILSFTPSASDFPSTTGYYDCIIVYFDSLETPSFDFNGTNGTNIKSIDYIGNAYHSLSFTADCPFLEEINLSNNSDSLDVKYGGYRNDASIPGIYNGNFQKIVFAPKVFAGSTIKKIVFPTSQAAYAIPESCFEGCTELLEVVIPDGSVTTIGKNAFKKCTNLRYVYIGQDVTNIGEGAFEECTYSSLEFETPYSNTKFLGEKCALLRKNPDKTYSVIHATTNWMDNWPVEHHMVYLASDLPNYINPATQHIGVDFINTNSNEIKCVDIHGTTFRGSRVTPSQTNPTQLNSVRQDENGTLVYAMPVYKLIKDFEPRACINTSMPYLHFRTWDSLDSIGKEAFKGGSIAFQTPPRFGFHEDETHDYIMDSFYIQGYSQTFTIGEGAFENNDNRLSSIALDKKTIFGDKCFYNCQYLESIDFREYTPQIDNIVWNNNTGEINWSDTSMDIGKLCFANTPNLASITCSSTPNNNTVKCNAICYFNNQGTHGQIIVGCKNTNFATLHGTHNVHNILENAFYGCTSLTVNNNQETVFDGYDLIGSGAFYGCSGLISTETSPILFKGGDYNTANYYMVSIGPKAFYGCSGIQYLYLHRDNNTPLHAYIASKAFANSGVTKLVISSNAEVEMSSELDAFDGCVINTIQSDAVRNGLNVIDYSNIDDTSGNTVHNALLVGESSVSTNKVLVKSGTGKDIINSNEYYDDQGRNITKIKTKAFTGVSLNDGNNTIIHIPKSVTDIEANIFDGSKTDNLVDGNPSKPCHLKLDGVVYDVYNWLINDGYSRGLLYYVGGKYFKKIVEDTAENKRQGYHYYKVEEILGTYNKLVVSEAINNTKIADIAEIKYNTNRDIVVIIHGTINWDYKEADTVSHVTQLDNDIVLTLMYYYQQFSPQEESIYCYGGITPGTTWQDNEVLDDITRQAKISTYYPYNSLASGAFSNCKWVKTVYSQRILNASKLFSGCTNLKSIGAYDKTQNNLSMNIFNGEILESTFEGCTSLTSITGTDTAQYPIKFGANAFKGCTAFNLKEMLDYGIIFSQNSFNGAGLENVTLYSALEIHPTAFDNITLNSAKADSTCGYYFTGRDKASIVDDRNKIVVGSLLSDLNVAKGVKTHAFYGVNLNNSYVLDSINDYTIDDEAFANSSILRYEERNCKGTIIGQKAFKNCVALTEVILGDSTRIGESAFEGCSTLYNVTLGNVDIPANAFNGCTNLSNINLNLTIDSHAVIAPSAFIGCHLDKIQLPNNVDHTYKYKFDIDPFVQAAKWIYEYDDDGHYKLLLGTKVSYYLTKRVKVIGQHAYNGRGLTGEIKIPESVTKIEANAYANNPGITKVYMPSTIEYIGENAFSGCTGLVRVVLPDSCKYVGANAFKGCPLTEGFNCNTFDSRYYTNHEITNPVTINGSGNSTINSSMDLTNTQCFGQIGVTAFAGCNIQVIKLPKSCTSIGVEAFAGCNSLVELHLSPSNANIIKDSAFYGCSYLGEIYLHTNNIPTLENYPTTKNHFYGIGVSIGEGHKHLHVLTTLQGDSTFTLSNFYEALVTENGFNVVYDLSE